MSHHSTPPAHRSSTRAESCPASAQSCRKLSQLQISSTWQREIQIPVSIESEGEYRVDFRYSNGTGPWHTDNNCASRSISVNGAYQGVLVFPQRGSDEWSDWGYSNALVLSLKKGINEIRVDFRDWNKNMDGEINEAMLDYLRIIRI